MSERDDELIRHFGTLWRSAMVGLDTLREVAVRSTQAGRLRVDIALLSRERSQVLETLGEMIVRMIDAGEFEDIPESVKQAYDRIKEVEQRLQGDPGDEPHPDPHPRAARGSDHDREFADRLHPTSDGGDDVTLAADPLLDGDDDEGGDHPIRRPRTRAVSGEPAGGDEVSRRH
jgi:hypothetical protein